MKYFLVLTLATISFASPISESVSILTNKAAKDIQAIASGTTKTLSNVLDKKFSVVGVAGGTVVNAASTAGDAAANLVTNINLDQALNKTEAAIIEKNAQLIKSTFDAKRQAIKLIKKVKDDHKDTVVGLFNTTINGLNYALNKTTGGIIATKEGVASVTSEVNLANAQTALNSAHAAITAAINTTLNAIDQTATALAKGIVGAKMSLHNAAMGLGTNSNNVSVNSNSSTSTDGNIVSTLNTNLGGSINGSFNTNLNGNLNTNLNGNLDTNLNGNLIASPSTVTNSLLTAGSVNLTLSTGGLASDSWGLFKAIENLSQLLSAIPTKVNNFIARKKNITLQAYASLGTKTQAATASADQGSAPTSLNTLVSDDVYEAIESDIEQTLLDEQSVL